MYNARLEVRSNVPFETARNMLSSTSPARAGRCFGLIAILLFVSCESLQDAVADGDTRTISMHHLHTNEDITITYKRDGRYDEDALKKINWFLRDWRKQEQTKMDPHLIDLVWEVSREVDAKKPIDIVCGYRSPQTNSMLRRRSSGVAKFSQHTLGKAMDVNIPGVPLEQIRVAGLRLQRGGVGYYPTSGSPFVHLDTGGVRHWPRMTREQLVRVFPDGRTVHIPSDGRPLSGYALALADIQKRGATLGAASREAASTAGIASAAQPARNLLASLFKFGKDNDEEADADEARKPAAPSRSAARNTRATPKAIETKTAETKTAEAKTVETAAAERSSGFQLASASSTPVPLARPSVAMDPARTGPSSNDVIAARGLWHEGANAGDARATSPDPERAAALRSLASRAGRSETTASIAPRSALPPILNPGDHASADVALAYAAPAESSAASVTNLAMAGTPALTRVAKRAPGAAHSVSVSVPVHVGQRYDDPWLRALVMTPDVQNFMTATLWGTPNYLQLRPLLDKPSSTVAMSFSFDPNLGMETGHFTGNAVVFLSTVSFVGRTAFLQ